MRSKKRSKRDQGLKVISCFRFRFYEVPHVTKEKMNGKNEKKSEKKSENPDLKRKKKSKSKS